MSLTESFKFCLHIPLNSLPILKDTVQLLAFCLKKENVHYIFLYLGLTRNRALNAVLGLLTHDGCSDGASSSGGTPTCHLMYLTGTNSNRTE